MKNFKKTMALVLAGAMTIGSLSFGTFAATGDMRDTVDDTITVTNLTAGDTVNFYQVIEWVGINDPATAGAVSGWKVKAPFDTVIDADELKAILVDDPDTTAKNDPRGITSELAGELARAATSATATVSNIPSTTASLSIGEGEGKYPAGMYMALITPKDVDTVYNPVFVSSDYFEGGSNSQDGGITADTYSDESAAKKSTLTLTKTASTAPEDTNDDGESHTVAVGDVVTFTVTTTIPGYGDVYENPVFDVTDTLEDLVLESIESVETGSPLADATSNATITPSTIKGSDTFTVSFKSDYLKGLKTATPVKIVYKAKVTSTAQKNINEEDNTVEIKYSHNPNDKTGKDLKAKKDTTQHYTFTLDAAGLGMTSTASGKKTSELIKVGVDGEGNPVYDTRTSSEITEENYQESPLAQAEFGVYAVKADADAENENYYKNDVFTTGKVTSDSAGRMTISGLDAGTYYLKELKAPAGFIKDPHTYTIQITTSKKTVKITEYYKVDPTSGDVDWKQTPTDGYTAFEYETEVLEWYKVTVDGVEAATHWFTNPGNSTEITWTETSANEVPSSIVNTKGVELPSTGGIGTTLFYAIGAILVLGAGILLVTRRRVNAN